MLENISTLCWERQHFFGSDFKKSRGIIEEVNVLANGKDFDDGDGDSGDAFASQGSGGDDGWGVVGGGGFGDFFDDEVGETAEEDGDGDSGGEEYTEAQCHTWEFENVEDEADGQSGAESGKMGEAADHGGDGVCLGGDQFRSGTERPEGFVHGQQDKH